MPLHFAELELQERRDAAAAEIKARGLHGLLMFRQESMYYLTGYDTFGYAMFQCLYLGADGKVILLTRMPDLRQARLTSDIQDIRIWIEEQGCNPADDLRAIIAEQGGQGQTLGIEYDAYGLTAKNWRLVEAALAGFCTLQDASDLVTEFRAVKSQAELGYHRRAAELADNALDAAMEIVKAGAFEGDLLAAMQGAVFKGGGDYAGNEFILGSGPGALLCRYYSGRRHLSAKDQLTIEWAGAFRRYHAAMMRTIVIGEPDPLEIAMHKACREGLEACTEALKPGRPMGDVFDAYARVMDEAGFHDHRFNACGYGMGAVYTPIWVDFPMFYKDNPRIIQAGQVFFLHMILMNSDAGQAMTLGHSVLVGEDGCEPLSRSPLDLLVA